MINGFQNQFWPTHEIFIGRRGILRQEFVPVLVALSSFVSYQPIADSLQELIGVAAGLTSATINNNIPFYRAVNDPVDSSVNLSSAIVFAPIDQSGTDNTVNSVSLSNAIVIAPLNQSVSDTATNAVVLTSASVGLNTVVTAWLSQIATAGGATPSGATIAAMNNFVNALSAAGLLTMIKALNAFVPDNLIASLTPIISGNGNLTWTNNNFVGGDLSVNGLQGNGSNKFLDTGVIPNSIFSGASGAMSIYVSVNPSSSNNDVDAGTSDNGGNDTMYLAATNSGASSLFDFHNNQSGQGRLTPSAIQNTGYFSANRASAILSSLFFASSTQTHTTAGTITTDGGGLPTHSIYCHAINNGGGPAILHTHKTLSMLAIHDPFTLTQSAAFYAIIQSMRMALGGGFV